MIQTLLINGLIPPAVLPTANDVRLSYWGPEPTPAPLVKHFVAANTGYEFNEVNEIGGACTDVSSLSSSNSSAKTAENTHIDETREEVTL